MVSQGEPLFERDRFFAAPRQRTPAKLDAQVDALRRLLASCERARPHLHSVEALERFIAQQPDPARVRRRIAVALAIEQPQVDRVCGVLSLRDLAQFRDLARHKLAAVVWVFT